MPQQEYRVWLVATTLVSLVISSSANKILVENSLWMVFSLAEKLLWIKVNHENNEIKSATKIFTYMVDTTLN